MSMREAVARFVPDGGSVCLNAVNEALIPFSAGHEVIRQRRRPSLSSAPSPVLFEPVDFGA